MLIPLLLPIPPLLLLLLGKRTRLRMRHAQVPGVSSAISTGSRRLHARHHRWMLLLRLMRLMMVLTVVVERTLLLHRLLLVMVSAAATGAAAAVIVGGVVEAVLAELGGGEGRAA